MLMSSRVLTRIAVAIGIVGFPLVLLSYSWVPFASAGRAMGAFTYVPLVGELGALLAAVASIGLGYSARRHTTSGTVERGLAARALVLGIVLMLLVVVPNLIATFLLRR